ncbi:hypothetical protein [uncultured Methylobacterium sp.]|uniref:hypothetical protein n=1 Tax=uncultured Methylobacterium sp. TaxID=157278 RepID=UPI0035CA13C2
MSTIRPYAAGTYAAAKSTTQILALKGQLDALSTQLSTGRTSETYAGLGAGRTTSLTARATLSALDGYDAGIVSAQTRVSVASTSLSQVTALTMNLRTSLTSNLQDASAPAASQLGRINLEGAIDALNQSAAGQYLFGGRASETEPVASSDRILNGDATTTPKRDGLVTLVAEQRAADLGADGLGRLELGAGTAANSFSLSEDTADPTGATRANFGFRIASAPTTTGSAITVTADAVHAAKPATVIGLDHAPAAGESFRVTLDLADGRQETYDLTARSPLPAGSGDGFGVFGSATDAAQGLNAFAAARGGTVASVQSANTPTLTATYGGGDYAAYDIGLSGQPAAGDGITVQLALHDGTTSTITLTAQASAPAGSTTTFAIGADAAATAANLRTALQTALKAAADGPLAASSTTRAAEDFFSASTVPGQAPRRIDASGATPTYEAAASTGTVIWYQGDATSPSARATASVRAGASREIAIGAQANEAPFRKALAGFAALAVDGLADPGASATPGRFTALASRAYDLLGQTSTEPSLEAIATDFGFASSALSDAKTQNAATRATLQSIVDSVERAPIEEVAAKLLEVQNRLQASYQITSSLSKLSLVNYLG